MKTINVPARKQAAPKAQEIFYTIENQMGRVPNLFATIGWSANTLKNYLIFLKNQSKGAFNAKERGAVNLAVSEENPCQYCLAAAKPIAET